LDVSQDKKILFVHVIHAENPDDTIAEIKSGFEQWVMEVFP
jgi:multisubunit Na+/H+ antiporter MnhE subunit